MTLLEGILLGLVQGATEFLPVSSSGHSVLIPALFGLSAPDLDLIAVAHQGTLVAVLLYFRRDLLAIITGVLRGLGHRHPLENEEARLGWLIVVGSLPAAAAGLALESFFEEIFSEPLYAAAFLLVTAAILAIGERLVSGNKTIPGLGWLDGFIIGLFQMLALFPGISRSGSTIAGGLWRGLSREAAARFSFLLGVPAILGAGLLALLDISRAGLATSWPTYVGIFLAAAISGYACIHFLLTWLRAHSLYIFAAYCAAFGTLYLLLSFLDVVP
jgi:undecaprenyl-diphosphatase